MFHEEMFLNSSTWYVDFGVKIAATLFGSLHLGYGKPLLLF